MLKNVWMVTFFSFAKSCDALMGLGKEEDAGAYCVCKPNYVGDRCEFCGPGYYGQPETIGKQFDLKY